MSMSWTGKIKAALQGEVDGADALARLASCAPLASLRQQLADRRLEVEIANVGEEWRVPDALASIAAPLWVAEGLITLAQSLCDAEAAAHPDRRSAMAPLTHGQVFLLLEPIDALQGEISGVLADPRRRSAVSLPVLARPYAHSEAGLMAERVPLPYVRGLLDGVPRLAGAVQLVADDYSALVSHPSTPPWLTSGFAVLTGNMAAAQTRLEAVQGRAAPLLHQQPADETALRNLAIDLWQLANTYLKLGQLITAPSLMPGAQPLPPRTQPATPAPNRPVTSSTAPPPATAPPPVAAPHPATPPGPPANAIRGSQPAPPVPPPTQAPTPAHDQPRVLPQIGAQDRGPAPAPPPAAGSAPAGTRPVESRPPDAAKATMPPGAQIPSAEGRRIARTERWMVSAQTARHRLRAAGREDQAERELAAFWDAKGWTLTAQEGSYLDEVAALVRSGAVALSGRSMDTCPFAPIYRVTRSAIQLLGHTLRPATLFSYEYQTRGQGLLADLPAQAGVPDTA